MDLTKRGVEMEIIVIAKKEWIPVIKSQQPLQIPMTAFYIALYPFGTHLYDYIVRSLWTHGQEPFLRLAVLGRLFVERLLLLLHTTDVLLPEMLQWHNDLIVGIGQL